ncbi:beta-1,3-galactosyl-O-glycosyl-glycoprotein beta-1,6-N-acetylglucosaminyltransferase-like [Physella acuta]|uniref:beta-1,3-galactosyl-O-glycosyl-glycoprotein beta-1,6-N-acetylglucosaminyltransferase-like n=1 Tax=Physella acuta TaxID=109671 RepID=UPI0027DB6C8B|nr:beta-1,3-galactosyl-O-glycosyl-glycoprotein beta-1,6-N-acetylglucosaminyltransferase-like [Physella acuta]
MHLICSKNSITKCLVACCIVTLSLLCTYNWLMPLIKNPPRNASFEEVLFTSDRRSWSRQHVTQLLQQSANTVKVSSFDCSRLLNNDTEYLNQVAQTKVNTTSGITDESYLNITTNCEHFYRRRGFITSSLTSEEEEFPIAYALIVYKDTEMVERLLRAIYRPQNYYCIHVDANSPRMFYLAVSAIAKCFTNVFLTTKRLSVKWGTFSVLEPELVCMRELFSYKKWKYFINLTGQEFPLKTNYELVKILKSFNGANSINGTVKYARPRRWRKKLPPLGLRVVKGSVHIVANRDYVDFVLHNETAQIFLYWTKGTEIPDETFFSSLNYNPQLGLQGTYKGDPDDVHEFVARYKIWDNTPELCAGRFTRDICILSTGDLPRLAQAKELFANKTCHWLLGGEDL